ncbi:MAG: helix-turn-helix domain-containing protein [Clostridia bacterium]|nr:helix-turn-helix domain-containing protein [Clostridia bacterium]
MRERAQNFDPRQTMRRSGFEVFHYREPKPDGVEVHHHDFYEIYFLLDGTVSYWIEGQLQHVKPGELLLINPMVLHRPVVSSESNLYERIVLWVDKDYLRDLSSDGADLTACFGGGNTLLLKPPSGQRAELSALLSLLVRESYAGDWGAERCAAGVFLQFMVQLNRLARNADSERDRREDASPLVSQVLTYIDEHYSEDLSLENLAGRFYVSKYHLSHAFSREVGTGLYRYILLKRLLTAHRLLGEGVPAGEVCSRCGFRDYTNFYRAFKAEYGVSPRTLFDR